jgi:geranylgeranyl diphosphate synthase, type I
LETIGPEVVQRQSFAQLLSGVREVVDDALGKIWDRAEIEHGGHGAAVSQPISAARELCLRGGKRLRAALVAVGHSVGTEQRDWKPALPACCAVELLQSYFLIHDDWMDQDRVRRGGPTVHAALEAHGTPPHLAACGAVLAGDYTLALATRTLAEARPRPEHWSVLFQRFAQMQLDAVVGQKLDVLGDGSNLDDVYRLKTASYTVLGPLQLGMILGAAPEWSSVELSRFAASVGVAFQLRDDLIGAFGDPAITGKARGNDLLAGKRTLLVSAALELAAPDAARLIRSVLGNAAASAGLVASALVAIEATGARERVERRIAALTADARAALRALRVEGPSRQLLEELILVMVERDS